MVPRQPKLVDVRILQLRNLLSSDIQVGYDSIRSEDVEITYFLVHRKVSCFGAQSRPF